MRKALEDWRLSTSRFKMHIALIGVMLIGALFAYGGAAWYYTFQMDKQDALYGQQINALATVLDANARGTLERLDNLTDKVEFLVTEVSRLVPKVDDAAEKASEAVQGVKNLPKG